MRAITTREPGGPDVLSWEEVRDPEPGPGDVLVEVAATAVNRADLLQRQGHYPPPKGTSDVLGLECSGTVAAVGEGVRDWRVGDEVCALLAGGGYAERVVVPAAQVLPVPEGVDLVTAASLPEVACTVWSNVVMLAGLEAGGTLLVHGGAGGIGTHAIQVGKALGARVAVTAGSAERLRRCAELGADVLVNYREQDFVEVVGAADVVLDNMGAAYLGRNVDVLAPDGHLVVIGMQGGVKGELNIGKLLAKRGSVSGTGLRFRPVEGRNGKGRIVAEVRGHVWPMIADGRVRPVVDRVLPIERAADGHRALEEGDVFGKVVLKV
ncbi:NAD(P)H-quinone oxidoreductase [Saccharothrix yanglingensis]|uniref:NAD(P)H-quinone oxidoreductase n=1 Tax=Saccharothrix yanglingensis TaxID=659496 RepID=A0ABU0WTP5_9PSEU|nr:NAD(P)H-quinone oxidoreductase [Saccharothrix yanglingensis]MDQ2583213.1 NAD(P)H-quinone oxidoreductase [Saccharothrix yanglingensis]